MATVIETRGLSKRYRLISPGYSTLREAVTRGMGRAVRRSRPSGPEGEIWALRNLDLQVEEGEALGVIGHNGAGKTTLLRLLTGITEPTDGVARTRGRIGALLEVGTGFHPELTGRENIYLNAALLGLSRRETSIRFDQIVEFSGVQRFLDMPLKRYSSGMALRLAFAVAAHIDPDILLVDEVLAVGDAEFQQRCLGKVSELESEGRTAVMVSHDLGVIARLCSRALWLEEGEIRYDGAAQHTVERYRRSALERLTPRVTREDANVHLSVALLDEDGGPAEAPRRDQPIRVQIDFELMRSMPSLDVALYVVNSDGLRVVDDALSDHGMTLRGAGRHHISVSIPPLLRAGDYILGVWIGNEFVELFDNELLEFTLLPHPEDRDEHIVRARLIQPPLGWQVGTQVASADER